MWRSCHEAPVGVNLVVNNAGVFVAPERCCTTVVRSSRPRASEFVIRL